MLIYKKTGVKIIQIEEKKQVHKLLLIQLRQIGDVLMTTPAIRNLRENFPNAKIDFLVEHFSANALKSNTNISNLIIIPRKLSIIEYMKLIIKLYKEHYDVVIDFMGNPKSAQFTYFTFAPIRIGWNFHGRKYAYTHKIYPTENMYSAYGKLELLHPILSNISEYSIEFQTDDDSKKLAKKFLDNVGIGDNDTVFALFPVSRRSYKIWSAEKFAQLADYLINKYKIKILMIYGPGEYDLIKNVVNKMNNTPIYNYDMPNLTTLNAILRRCSLFIGNDGGPKHLAVAGNVPTFAIFGHINPINWTPPNNKFHRYIYLENLSCRSNCNVNKCQNMICFSNITVEMVKKKIDAMISDLNLV